MKKGVIMFHSNISSLYEDRWVKKSINSMLNQTDSEYTFYEIDYSGSGLSLLGDVDKDKKFWSIKMKNYASAMNFILDRAFEDDCDYVFNMNLDDYYHSTRIEKQIELISQGYDIVSSDFCYIKESKIGNEFVDDIILYLEIDKLINNLEYHLFNGNNIIAHPSVCYSKNFWKNNKYDFTKVPEEDFDLWKRTFNSYNFSIHSEVLLYYRRHDNQVSIYNK
jgi:hypothetical protein